MTDSENSAPQRRLIAAERWEAERWTWMEMTRRDHDLGMFARNIACYLATEKANRKTMRCDPSYREIGDVFGKSEDSVKRAIRELISGGWLAVIEAGRPGRSARYGFLIDARIVALHGGKNAPIHGGKNAPIRDGAMGAKMHPYGGKNAPPYIKDKPKKNQREAVAGPRRSENPMVIADAKKAVERFRNGQSDAIEAEQPWVKDHIIAAGLLSDEERAAVGLG